MGHPGPYVPLSVTAVGGCRRDAQGSAARRRLTWLYRQLKTPCLLCPELSHRQQRHLSLFPPSKTKKLKQYASFMHLKKQRKSELKTDWCLCLHEIFSTNSESCCVSGLGSAASPRSASRNHDSSPKNYSGAMQQIPLRVNCSDEEVFQSLFNI